MACEGITQTTATGDGVTTVFDITFKYFEDRPSEVKVALYDDTTESWVDQANPSVWSLKSITEVEFVTAPPASNTANIKIYRDTTIDPLKAQFYAGSAIRAQDLNANFQQLQYAIEDNECNVSTIKDRVDDIDDDIIIIKGNQYWDRTGTDLSPKNSGDNLTDVGGISAAGGDFTVGTNGKIDSKYLAVSDGFGAQTTLIQALSDSNTVFRVEGKNGSDTGAAGSVSVGSGSKVVLNASNGNITAQGQIETQGGIKYADGTVQTTAYIDGLPANAFVGVNPPANPVEGDLWYCSTDGRLFIYYTDANTSQWVDASPSSGGGGGSGPEVGDLQSVTDNGSTTTNGITAAGGDFDIQALEQGGDTWSREVIKDNKDNRTIYVGRSGSFSVTDGVNAFSVVDDDSNSAVCEIGYDGSITAKGNLSLDLGQVTNPGKFTDCAVVLDNPTNVGDYSQIGFGYTGQSTQFASAYIGYVSTLSNPRGKGDLVFGTRDSANDEQPTERFRIKSDGNITAAGAIRTGDTVETATSSFGVLDPSGQLILQNKEGDNNKAVFIAFDGTYTAGQEAIKMAADGSAIFKGNVTADGTILTRANGTTLDVKDRLDKVDTALTNLKAALGSISDFAQLKTALTAALSDI